MKDMQSSQNELTRRFILAVESRDRRFEGMFVVAVTSTGIYCRPGCPARTPLPENMRFYATGTAAAGDGFRPCRRCRPELSAAAPSSAQVVARVLRLIEEGALEEASVDQLAERAGIGARHLRRLLVTHVGAPPRGLKQAPRARKLRLRARQPFDFAALAGFLAPRATPGVEAWEGDVYHRTLEISGQKGVVVVRPIAPGVELTVPAALAPHLLAIVGRVRRLFDLDADPRAIQAHLARDPRLTRALEAHPGLRVPGAWDAFESTVRAILGQQVTVRGATTLAGRLAAAFGEPSGVAALPRLFPRPEALRGARLESLGLPHRRAQAIRDLAQGLPLEEIRGVGPWTRAYVALRGGDPDAFPADDHALKRALGVDRAAEAERRADRWRPWRAYAALHLWMEP